LFWWLFWWCWCWFCCWWCWWWRFGALCILLCLLAVGYACHSKAFAVIRFLARAIAKLASAATVRPLAAFCFVPICTNCPQCAKWQSLRHQCNTEPWQGCLLRFAATALHCWHCGRNWPMDLNIRTASKTQQETCKKRNSYHRPTPLAYWPVVHKRSHGVAPTRWFLIQARRASMW